MRYEQYKTAIQRHLQRQAAGATWAELRSALALPYDRPCPEWTRMLEQEIGLVRRKGSERSLIWSLEPAHTPKTHV
jgi:hypothetical protein